MKMMLAENIRRFRKERSLTQEQLSEALGVTAGAVYKWEAKLSIPELDLIVQMADFFDTSVDVLLGYEVKDNRLLATVKRLQECRRKKDWEGLSEADKALKKYPHSFQVVKESAAIYRAFGIESGDKELFRRALELLERSRLLLDQNTDPEINEQTICGKIAETYLGLDEVDRKVLDTIINKYNGGPVGLNTIAASISEEPDTIMDVVEPYLLQLGLIDRTPQGRTATRKAYEHLGITYPERKNESSQAPLF